MSEFAQLDENDLVAQIILADQDFINSGMVGPPASWMPVVPVGSAGIGYRYDRDWGQFVPPGGAPTPPPEPPLALVQFASAKLLVAEWEVTGIERSTGISGAFVADVDTAWVYFSEEQPDTNYILMPADGFTKFTDHVEVSRPGLSELSFLVFRVQ